MVEFVLKEFDINDFNPQGSIFILGARRTGKTTLIKRLISNTTRLHIIFTGCDWEYPEQQPYVHTDMQEFPNIVKVLKTGSASREAYLVIDDLINEPDGIMEHPPLTYPLATARQRWESTKIAKEVVFTSRHWKTIFILASRYMLIQQPALRVQLGYVFIFPDSIRGDKRRLQYAFKYYCPYNISSEVFTNCLESLTDNQVLVIDKLRNNIYYFDPTTTTRNPPRGTLTKSAAKRYRAS